MPLQMGETLLHNLKNQAIELVHSLEHDELIAQQVHDFSQSVLTFYRLAERICADAIVAGELDSDFADDLEICISEASLIANELIATSNLTPKKLYRLKDLLVLQYEKHEVVYEIVQGCRMQLGNSVIMTPVQKAIHTVVFTIFPTDIICRFIPYWSENRNGLRELVLLPKSGGSIIPSGIVVPDEFAEKPIIPFLFL